MSTKIRKTYLRGQIQRMFEFIARVTKIMWMDVATMNPRHPEPLMARASMKSSATTYMWVWKWGQKMVVNMYATQVRSAPYSSNLQNNCCSSSVALSHTGGHWWMVCLGDWTISHHALSFKMPCTAPDLIARLWLRLSAVKEKYEHGFYSPRQPRSGTWIIHGGLVT